MDASSPDTATRARPAAANGASSRTDATNHGKGAPSKRVSSPRTASWFGQVTVVVSVLLTVAAVARMSSFASEEALTAVPGGTGDDGTAVETSEAQARAEWRRIEQVMWLGWVTAACTGLGVLPFVVTRKIPDSLMGASNAVACGMMVAASIVLLLEGVQSRESAACHAHGHRAVDTVQHDGCEELQTGWFGLQWGVWGLWRTALGLVVGAVGVKVVEALVPENAVHAGPPSSEGTVGHDGHTHGHIDAGEDDSVASHHVAGCPACAVAAEVVTAGDESAIASAASPASSLWGWVRLPPAVRRGLVFLVVMAAHSLAEGIGLGVSFGGHRGALRGPVISTTLAVHNIPEGLAICLVLIPKGEPLADAAAWAVLSSLPQPLVALPALLFVETFTALLPIGLGFAAGAMFTVSAQELWPQAVQELGSRTAALVVLAATAAMLVFQFAVHDT